MAAAQKASGKSAPSSRRGIMRFELEPAANSLSIYLDRVGFRRLVLSLEELALSGQSQTLAPSSRPLRRPPATDGVDRPTIIRHVRIHLDKA
jgi:hypothetical protein